MKKELEELSFEELKKLWIAIKFGFWEEQNILEIKDFEQAMQIKKRIEQENDTYALYRYLNVEVKGMPEKEFHLLLFKNMANHYFKNNCQ